MSIVTAPRRSFNRSSIDAAAEAEGTAMEWQTEHLGINFTTRLDRLRQEAAEVERLGLPPVQHPRYGRAASLRTWQRIVDGFKQRPRPYITTQADRDRQAADRAARAIRIAALVARAHTLPEVVSVNQASAMISLSPKAISTAAKDGRLPATRAMGRYQVRTSDLLAYAAA